jgi:hypothetical protein
MRLRRQLLRKHPSDPILIAALAFSFYGPRGRGRVKGFRLKWTEQADGELWTRFSEHKAANSGLKDIATCRILAKQEPYSQNLPGRDPRSIQPKSLAKRVREIRSSRDSEKERS